MAISLPVSVAASQEAVDRIISRYRNLPADYLEFLSLHDGAEPVANVVRGTGNAISVRSFLPATSIPSRADGIEGMPADMMPIADDDSGNYICFDTKDGSVKFWDHETDQFTRIASDFTEFLDKLIEFDQTAFILTAEQVKSVWVKPGFKPEF